MTTHKWLKTCDMIQFDVTERVARITLNRPEKKNALNAKLLAELNAALEEADDRTDVGVVLIQGAGRDFCAGFDLAGAYGGGKEAEPDYDSGRYRTRNGTIDDDCWHLEHQQQMTAITLDMHKPVICKVQGYCLAGGTDIAFACDMVVAAADARFGYPAARANGTPPSSLWLYHLGPQWAKRMLFTGDMLTGSDAATLGLVLDAYPAEQLDAEVDEMVRRIACVDPELLAAHKRSINFQLELMGAKTSLRYSVEADARAHLAAGPMRTRFRADMKKVGLKQALKNRDAPFGDSVVKLSRA